MADARLELVDVDRVGCQLAIAVLDRPRVANAFTVAMVEELHAILDDVIANDNVRVFILTGAERHFSAGGDLREGRPDPTDYLDRVRSLFDRVSELRQPTIAAINGAAAGGGCEIALACDLRIIDERATIGLPEVRFGSVAYAGGTQRMPRLIGPAKALELHLIGDLISAQEAVAIGLVNRVAPAGTALEQAIDLAKLIASRPRLAVETATHLIRQSTNLSMADGLALEAELATELEARLREQLSEAAGRDPVYERILGRPSAVEPDTQA